MDTKFTASMPPTMASEFLRVFVGKRVVDLIRYSWWPAEEVGVQCGIANSLAFSLTMGPLAIQFVGGCILGLASDPALNSVVVWDEAGRNSTAKWANLANDPELFPISASNGQYATSSWQRLVGYHLTALTILKNRAMSRKELERPGEVGLRFIFSNGKSFVASHGLHDGSDDFSVLEESQLSTIEFQEFALT